MGKNVKIIKKTIPDFPINLRWERKMIIDPSLGTHDQFAVLANELEIARFIEPASCHNYIEHLAKTHFSSFKKSKEGLAILDVLYLLSQGQKMKVERDPKNGGIIIRDLAEKNKIN